MYSSGKKFADFIAALNDDLLKLTKENEGHLDNEQVINFMQDTITQMGERLTEKSTKGELEMDNRTFNLLLDVVTNFALMDNVRLCSVYKGHEVLDRLLLQRIDVTWAYFRQILDSFPLARGLAEGDRGDGKDEVKE